MDIKDLIFKTRRHLHMNPEVGYETYNTAKYLKQILNDLGYVCYDVVEKAGIIAKINLNKTKTIALRADIDALNIKELNDCDYKSTNNFMHACGHDAHAAMLIGAAKLIMDNKDMLNANVTLIFQPAEEGPLPGGAIKIIQSGLLNDVNNFYALHVTNILESGFLGIKKGEAFAAPDLFSCKIIGIGCHASTPNLGNNPILPTTEIILKFNQLYQKLKKDKEIVITTSQINSGTAKNIIPNDSYFAGTARSFNQKDRQMLKKQLTNIVNKTANKYGVKAEFDFMFAYDPVYNHPEASDYLIRNAKGSLEVLELTEKAMVGEDFSYYSQIANSAIAWLGVKKDKFIDLHSPYFTLDEEALLNGSKLLYNLAINYNK